MGESVYLSTLVPPELAKLSLQDAGAYLARIGLAPELATEAPSLELLSKLMVAHHTSIPYDTSALHVSSEIWNSSSPHQLGFGAGPGMQLGPGNYERIVKSHRGGYCYALNMLFASLLRSFGYSVSEVSARVYMNRGKDPVEAGYLWSALTHVVLLVEWQGGPGRFFCDVGFGGGGCPFPIPLKDGAVMGALSPVESFLLRTETLPSSSHPGSLYRDVVPGFTLYRKVVPRGGKVSSPETAHQDPGYWTPCIHFNVITACPNDLVMANFYNEKSPEAVWVSCFLVSILLPTGARKSLMFGAPPKDASGDMFMTETGRRVKMWTKEGIKGEETDIQWFDYESNILRAVLEKEFGFKF